MSIADALRSAGIEPRHARLGKQRLACPSARCQAKHRANDDALALLIESNGATWLCHRCGFKGGVRDGKAPTFASGAPKPKPAPESPAPAARALAIWRGAVPAPGHHPYLVRKRIPPDGLRIVPRFAYSTTGALDHALLVPMRDESDRIVNLQGIAGDGTKRFMRGGKVRGTFAYIGSWRGEVAPECLLAIGEGWASVTSYHRMHLAYRGIAALSSGNLPTVARLFRAKYPNAEIVIVCDQDEAGVRAAGEATVAVNGVLHAPGFGFTGIIDWNDLECRLNEAE